LQVSWSFSHVGSGVNHGEALRIHDGKDSFALIEKSAIEDQVASGAQIGRDRWRMPKPILDDALHCPNAVTTLSGNLSQRVAFDNPALEPDPLAQVFVGSVLPDKSPTALPTVPALLSLTTLSVSLHLGTMTARTMLFLPSKHHHC
jgi:hypothetical protein